MKKFVIIFAVIVISCGIYYFLPEPTLPKDIMIDRIVVRKNDQKMDVFSGGKLIKTYSVSLGQNPIGDKQEEGIREPRKASIESTRKIRTAHIIRIWVFPIRIRKTNSWQEKGEGIQAEKLKFMD